MISKALSNYEDVVFNRCPLYLLEGRHQYEKTWMIATVRVIVQLSLVTILWTLLDWPAYPKTSRNPDLSTNGTFPGERVHFPQTMPHMLVIVRMFEVMGFRMNGRVGCWQTKLFGKDLNDSNCTSYSPTISCYYSMQTLGVAYPPTTSRNPDEQSTIFVWLINIASDMSAMLTRLSQSL